MSRSPRKRHRSEDDEIPGTRVPDERLAALFDDFGGRLISPGGAAAMLGVSRQRVYALVRTERLRCFRSDDYEPEAVRLGPIKLTGPAGPKWAYIPLDDVYAVADELGRPVRRGAGGPVE